MFRKVVKLVNERNRRYGNPGGSAPVGSRIRPRYRKDCRETPPKLVKVGETDQYSFIQSFKDSCDIARIVERAMAGDSSVLQRVQGVYTDVTAMPETMTELMNLGIIAADAWDNLNPDIKAKFDSEEDFKNALLNSDLARFAPAEPAASAPAPAEGEVTV